MIVSVIYARSIAVYARCKYAMLWAWITDTSINAYADSSPDLWSTNGLAESLRPWPRPIVDYTQARDCRFRGWFVGVVVSVGACVSSSKGLTIDIDVYGTVAHRSA